MKEMIDLTWMYRPRQCHLVGMISLSDDPLATVCGHQRSPPSLGPEAVVSLPPKSWHEKCTRWIVLFMWCVRACVCVAVCACGCLTVAHTRRLASDSRRYSTHHCRVHTIPPASIAASSPRSGNPPASTPCSTVALESRPSCRLASCTRCCTVQATAPRCHPSRATFPSPSSTMSGWRLWVLHMMPMVCRLGLARTLGWVQLEVSMRLHEQRAYKRPHHCCARCSTMASCWIQPTIVGAWRYVPHRVVNMPGACARRAPVV